MLCFMPILYAFSVGLLCEVDNYTCGYCTLFCIHSLPLKQFESMNVVDIYMSLLNLCDYKLKTCCVVCVCQICCELEVSEGCLDQLFLSSNTTHISQFKLHQRALHVYQGLCMPHLTVFQFNTSDIHELCHAGAGTGLGCFAYYDTLVPPL